MVSTTELLSSFNEKNLRKILSKKNMKPHLPYNIKSAFRTTTKFGDSIVLELQDDDQILYLPKRFNSLKDTELEYISTGKFSVTKSSFTDNPESNLYTLVLDQIEPLDSFYGSY